MILHIVFIKLKYFLYVKVVPWHYCKLCGVPNCKLICTDCINELLITKNYHVKPNTNTLNKIYYDVRYPSFCYENPLRKLLHYLKYKRQIDLNWSVGYVWYLSFITYNLKHIDYIIPVPLARDKTKSRGFNQVYLMLEYYMAVNNQIPVMPKLIRKIKENNSQVSTAFIGRQANVKDSFKVMGSVLGKRILLVDDVFTTGATINEISRVLKIAGAVQVDILPLMYVAPHT